MKRKLLYLNSIMLFSVLCASAQIKVWNFAGNTLAGYDNVLDSNAKVEAVLYAAGKGGNIAVSGAANAGVTGPPVVLGNLIGSFGATTDKVFYVSANQDRLRIENTTITSYNNENLAFFDSFFGVGAPWGRFYINGTSSTTNRYFGFNLAIGESITMYYYTDTTTLDVLTVESPTGTLTTTTIDNTGTNKTGRVLHLKATEAGIYKVYSGAAKLCVGRIYEGEITLGTNDFNNADSKVAIFGVDGKINVANVTAVTKVSVYSVTGALVKSAETTEDASLSVKSGVYIVKAESEEGIKTVKVLVK